MGIVRSNGNTSPALVVEYVEKGIRRSLVMRIDAQRLDNESAVCAKLLLIMRRKFKLGTGTTTTADAAVEKMGDDIGTKMKEVVSRLVGELQRTRTVIESGAGADVSTHQGDNVDGESARENAGVDAASTEHRVDDDVNGGDLNAVGEEELAEAKQQMDVAFEQNRKKFGEEGFVYDIMVDFGTEHCSAASGTKGEWDSSDDEENDENDGDEK